MRNGAMVKTLEAPHTAVSDDIYPPRKKIEGQWCARWVSPYADWPGVIYVPEVISPAQYVEFWRKSNEERDDLPDELLAYLSRRHLVVEWHLEGLQPKWLEDFNSCPTMEIPLLVISATRSAIAAALSPPKLAGSSTNGASGEPLER